MDTPVPGTFYTGKFDGSATRSAISSSTGQTTDFVGLFGALGTAGTVSNVGLVGGSAVGRQAVGGLAGENAGTISRSYNTGSVSSSGSGGWINFIGGLVGFNNWEPSPRPTPPATSASPLDLRQSFSAWAVWLARTSMARSATLVPLEKVAGATTRNSSGFGGLDGYAGYGTYSNVGATGGGRVGLHVRRRVGRAELRRRDQQRLRQRPRQLDLRVRRRTCRHAGHTTGTTTNGYWNVTTSGKTTSRAGTGLDATQVTTAANFAGFNFTTTAGATGNNW